MLFAAALRRSLAEGDTRETFRADVASGLVVGVVALPLSMALSIAVGVAPQHGLYTAIVAGAEAQQAWKCIRTTGVSTTADVAEATR